MTGPTGLNIVIFDCEIKNEIDGKNITWNDHHKMGHAVSCLYDYLTQDYKIYMDDNADEMCARINSADMVVGFAIKQFDIPLLQKTPEIKIKPAPKPENIYDMLEYSRRATGWTEKDRYPTGLRLDEHLQAMFGADGMKSGDGANAPKLWQEKKLGELCSYVIRDVNREKALFEYMWFNGEVKTKTHGVKKVILPQVILEFIRAKKILDQNSVDSLPKQS